MKIISPEITRLSSNGYLTGRKSKAVFVRKHNLEANLKVVKSETQNVTHSNAQKHLFLVEGYKKYPAVENCYLDSFIEELSIKAEDPIKSPLAPEVAQAASIDKTVAALSFLVMDYLDLMADHQIEQLDNDALEIFFDQSLCSAAKAFGVSSKELRSKFLRLKWRNEEALNQQIFTLASKRKKLIKESNSQSKTRLVKVLNKHRQPNLFIMTGIEHATIFTQ